MSSCSWSSSVLSCLRLTLTPSQRIRYEILGQCKKGKNGLKSGSLSADAIRWPCWWSRMVSECSRQGRWFPSLLFLIASKENKQACSHFSTAVLFLCSCFVASFMHLYFTHCAVHHVYIYKSKLHHITQKRGNEGRIFRKQWRCNDQITLLWMSRSLS